MGAAHLAAAHMHRGGQHFLRADALHQHANAHHVGHGIQRAHLVKVDFAHRLAMGMGFGLGDEGIHGLCVFPHLFGNGQVREQVHNIRHARMAMGMVVVVMAMVEVMIAVVVMGMVVVMIAVAVVVLAVAVVVLAVAVVMLAVAVVVIAVAVVVLAVAVVVMGMVVVMLAVAVVMLAVAVIMISMRVVVRIGNALPPHAH